MKYKHDWMSKYGNWEPNIPEPVLDDSKCYAKIGGRIVEYTRYSYFKDSYSSIGYLGSGGIYVSYGNYVEAVNPNNREIMHFWE